MKITFVERVFKLIGLIIVFTVVVTLSGCANSAAKYDVSAIGPKIHVGIVTDEPGIGFVQAGQYSGLDVEVAKYIVHELGYIPTEIVWHSVEPINRENALINGKVDLVLGSYSITQERKQQVDFAGPYFTAGQDLLVRKNDNHISSVKDLTTERVCTVKGSTSGAVIQEHAPHVQVQERDRISVCITALLAGETDAVSADDIALFGLAEAQGGGQLKVVGAPFSVERYGVAVRYGQPTLVKQINAALKAMIDDGSWDKAVKTSFENLDYKFKTTDRLPEALNSNISSTHR